MRLQTIFRSCSFTFSFNSLPNEEKKENVQKITSFNKDLNEKIMLE